MRTTSLTAVALLGAALVAPMSTAAAAGETCQGQAATIVGTPEGQITGTEGADVIVTNGAVRVDALGGNDTVCSTGENGGVTYATGVIVVLGAGADTFIPSERDGSTVYAGTVDGTDTEADVIRSSGTAGLIISGMAGQPNADIIDLLALTRGSDLSARTTRPPSTAALAATSSKGTPAMTASPAAPATTTSPA